MGDRSWERGDITHPEVSWKQKHEIRKWIESRVTMVQYW
jgi:hypothetical protein